MRVLSGLMAVNQYLSVHEYHLRQIKEGLAQARAGKLIEYEQVKANWKKRLAKSSATSHR